MTTPDHFQFPQRRPGQGNENADMTPMLDVVFILLIFFVVTASFLRETTIPVTGQNPAPSVIQNDSSHVRIAIDNDNRVYLNRQAVAAEALRARVLQEKAADADLAVTVSPSFGSNAGILVSVINQLRLAGVENIRVSE